MYVSYIILAAFPVLLLGMVAFLVFIAVGIRMGDRRNLASPPRNRIDAITRRLAGLSVRNGADNEGSES